MRRLALALSLVLLVLAASGIASGKPAPVEAHALLARADPPANAQVREPPAELTLYFTEALERKFTRVRVLDQSNAEVQDRVEFDASDNTVVHVFLNPLKPGYLTVNWGNVSAVDGHGISGSYPLTVLNPDGSVPPGSPPIAAASSTGAQAKPPRVLVKALLLIAGSLLTGALAMLVFVHPAIRGAAAEGAREAMWRWASRTALAAVIVAIGFNFLDLLLQASDLDSDIGGVIDTRWGGRWVLRNLALLLPLLASIAVVAVTPTWRRVSASAGLVGCLAYLGLTSSVSHAAAGAGSFWATGADFVHLLAASVWIGMLAQMAAYFLWASRLAADERYPALVSALRRFSALASVSVALLLFTGTVSAVIEVARFSDLLDSAYGRILLSKLILLVPLLAIGGINAYVLRPDLDAATEATGLRNRGAILQDLEGQLTRLVRWEFGLAIVVLAVVGLLSQTTPTRGASGPEQTLGKYTATRELDDIGVTLVIDPNQPGLNTFEVYLTGAVETIERVRLDFRPNGNVDQEARLILDASNPPTFYVGQGAFISQPGKWEIITNLRRSRGNDLDIRFETRVATAGGQTSLTAPGQFESPVSFDAASIFLVVASGVLAIGLVAGGAPRPGLPAGYLGDFVGAAADRINIGRVRPIWSLSVLVFIGVALGIVLGSHFDKPLSRQQAAQGNPVNSTPESIARGQMLFSQNCVTCHGESGRGDGPAAAGLRIPPANLYDHVPYHPDQFFFGVIANGLGGVMPAFKSSISEEDRWNILNFLRDRFGQAPLTQ